MAVPASDYLEGGKRSSLSPTLFSEPARSTDEGGEEWAGERELGTWAPPGPGGAINRAPTDWPSLRPACFPHPCRHGSGREGDDAVVPPHALSITLLAIPSQCYRRLQRQCIVHSAPRLQHIPS